MDPKHEGQNLSMIICFTNSTHIVITKNSEKSMKDQNNKMLVMNRNDRKIVLLFLSFRLYRPILIRASLLRETLAHF